MTEVTQYLADKLDGDDEVTPLNVEKEAIRGHGYALIDTERIFKRKDESEELWRLAIRLCANEDGLWAEVFTGIVGDDGANVSIRGGTPKFVRDLAEDYLCRIGPHGIGCHKSKQDLALLASFYWTHRENCRSFWLAVTGMGISPSVI